MCTEVGLFPRKEQSNVTVANSGDSGKRNIGRKFEPFIQRHTTECYAETEEEVSGNMWKLSRKSSLFFTSSYEPSQFGKKRPKKSNTLKYMERALAKLILKEK